MTLLLRMILIIVSVLAFTLVILKIRYSKMKIEDAVFWVLMLLMIVVFAVFPAIPDFLARLLGIYSTANFLFLFIIFLLIMKVFAMSVRMSELETRYKELVQNEALERASEEERSAGQTEEDRQDGSGI